MNVIGAIRALIVADGTFGARVWADRAPAGATFPYVTLHDAISVVREFNGDGGKADRLARQVQVSVWQRLDTEDSDVPAHLYRLLHTARLPAPWRAISLRVDGVERLSEPGNNSVQSAITLSVRHSLSGL